MSASYLAADKLCVPHDEAAILQSADGKINTLIFHIDAELLARIELVAGLDAGLDAWNCDGHKAMVLNYLLERGTTAKEAELAAQAGQEDLF